MTRNDNGEQVRLAGSNWLGLIAANIGTALAPVVLLYGRFVAMETTVQQNTSNIAALELRLDETRREFVGELRALRLELKDHK